MKSGQIKEGLRFLLAKVTGKIPSQTIRLFLYRNFFHARIGKHAVFYGRAEIRSPEHLMIEDQLQNGHPAGRHHRARRRRGCRRIRLHHRPSR